MTSKSHACRSSKSVEFVVQVVIPANPDGGCRTDYTDHFNKGMGKTDKFAGEWDDHNPDPGGKPFARRQFADDHNIKDSTKAFQQTHVSLSQYLCELGNDGDDSSMCFDHAAFHDLNHHKGSFGMEEESRGNIGYPSHQHVSGQADSNGIAKGSGLDALLTVLPDFKFADATSDKRAWLGKLQYAVCQFFDREGSEQASDDLKGSSYQMNLGVELESNEEAELRMESSSQWDPSYRRPDTEHPNVIPLALAVRGSHALFVLYPSAPYTLSVSLVASLPRLIHFECSVLLELAFSSPLDAF
ncbi:hypothetical protein CBR_g49229 [Chara braunii]|uniref:Uncharacterized protein n=1 Tax=Chara braunii TaxID=69332 RepID=A0A388M4C0_CHABU|nr:hypothetical protein CBR_g49229 [Chara braunii]|eukprot:GBG89438.1 hypothetical protein CBR_g49229 [Chara braunii]